MATLNELAEWTAGIYQLEEDDVVQGGPDGIDNVQAKQLANRTQYLKSVLEAAGDLYQPIDPTLSALAALATQADRLIYATGGDTFTLTELTAYARTLLASADAAVARAALAAAPLASPALTGSPTAPTAAPGTNTTQLATTAFVQSAAAALVGSSPAALDTLNELASALGNDANFSATITNALALKAALASPNFTGNPTAPTPNQFDNDSSLATTEFVRRSLGSFAGGVSYAAGPVVLTAADVGCAIAFSGVSNATLPDAQAVPLGASLFVTASGSGDVTLLRAGGNTIQRNDGVAVTSFVVKAGTSVRLRQGNGGTSWLVVEGDGLLPYSSMFSSSIAASGYQKLPGGLIVQWQTFNSAINSTSIVTLPIAFPNNFFGTVVTIRDNVANLVTDPISSALPLTNSTFSLRSYYSGSNINNFCVSLGN
ncbi:MAG: hypothetical protein K2X51_12490 [Burkholderiales bacterium]|nr:hypothetical protein [Burkholderiales bacterium]